VFFSSLCKPQRPQDAPALGAPQADDRAPRTINAVQAIVQAADLQDLSRRIKPDFDPTVREVREAWEASRAAAMA